MTDLKAANAQRWAAAKLTRGPEFNMVAARLVRGKPRYQSAEMRTGVPWFVIAVIHEREASGDWTKQLGQGDPLNRVSTHVPAGRGPFESWEDGAYDALVKCPPYAASNKDWSAGSALAMLEKYNGMAYANHGVPSPYIWSGTDQYKSGKVLVDHGPIEPVADKQLGCAGLIMAMMALDPSIKFGDVHTMPAPPPPDVEPIPAPTSQLPSWLRIIGTILRAIFKRKM